MSAAFADIGPDDGADDGDERGPDDGRDRSAKVRGRRRFAQPPPAPWAPRWTLAQPGWRSGDGVVAGSPADPSAEQPVCRSVLHAAWRMGRRASDPARRAEADVEEPAWEIKGAVQEPETEVPQRGQRDEVDVADEPAVAAASATNQFEAHAPELRETRDRYSGAGREANRRYRRADARDSAPEPAPAPEPRSDEPPRKGWWQRRFGGN